MTHTSLSFGMDKTSPCMCLSFRRSPPTLEFVFSHPFRRPEKWKGEQDQEGEQRKGAISAVTRATDPLPPSIYPSDQGPPPESKGVSLLQLKLRPWLQITAKAAVKGR